MSDIGSDAPRRLTGYVPRVVDSEVVAALRSVPAVVIEGPRACGKTTTGREHARSEVMFGSDAAARLVAQIHSEAILEGPEPRLLDEWQLAPHIWNQVRAAGDDGRRPGRFILTGSAVPADDVTRHSGAGRITRVRMRPMSLYECGLSTGEVSLAGLFASSSGYVERPDATLPDLIEAACRGGWPATLDLDTRSAQDYAVSYLSEICRADIPLLGGPSRDPIGVDRLLRSLARNVSTEASQRTLARDAGDENPLDPRTVAAYLDALRRVYVVEDQPAWSARLRSRTLLRQSAKRHLVDPSLAAAALHADPGRFWSDLGSFGLLFESMVVRDLRIYAQSARARVAHYRDSAGLEIDGIVERRDGAWIAIEIKLGGDKAVDAAASALLRLRRKVDPDHVGRPSNLVVVTSGGFGYLRPDGVQVIPITVLGP